MNKRNGSILMIALWILTILVVFAVNLGFRSIINMRLADYQRKKLQARFMAKAGLHRAITLILEDLNDSDSKDYDTLDLLGIKLSDQEPQEIFSRSWEGKNQGYRIGYLNRQGEFIFGMQDEDSKLNINGLTSLGIDIKALVQGILEVKGITDAEQIASVVKDWIDTDKEDLPEISFKNQNLVFPEELLGPLEYFFARSNSEKKEIQKKALQVYNEIKDYTSVYPQTVNINTASAETLKALVGIVAAQPDAAYVGSLVNTIIEFKENKNVFKDQASIDKLSPLSTEEKNILTAMQSQKLLDAKSNYIRIAVTGYSGKVTRQILAIFDRHEAKKKILYWHEN